MWLQHHCRKCGIVCCNTCSNKRWVLQHQSSKPVRVCLSCFNKLTIQALQMPPVAQPQQQGTTTTTHCWYRRNCPYISGFPRILESPWKCLNFFALNSRPWKYLKTGQVLESPWISFYRCLKVLEFTKSNCAISATSLNNISVWLKCILVHLTWSSNNSTQYSLLTYKISQSTEN